MAESGHERQLPHAALEHPRGVRVAKGMGCQPRIADPGPFRGPGEHPHQRVVAERLAASLPAATDEKHPGTFRFGGAFSHHVVVHRGQCAILQQVDHAVPARLLLHPAQVIVPFADGDPAPAVGDVLQLQAEHLARAEAALPHQLQQGPVPPRAQHPQQRRVGLRSHRTRQCLHRLDPQDPTDRTLSAGVVQRRPVTARHPRSRLIHNLDDRIVPARVRLTGDQELIERRHRSHDPVARLRRQHPALTGNDRKIQPLCPPRRGDQPQPEQELSRSRRRPQAQPPGQPAAPPVAGPAVAVSGLPAGHQTPPRPHPPALGTRPPRRLDRPRPPQPRHHRSPARPLALRPRSLARPRPPHPLRSHRPPPRPHPGHQRPRPGQPPRRSLTRTAHPRARKAAPCRPAGGGLAVYPAIRALSRRKKRGSLPRPSHRIMGFAPAPFGSAPTARPAPSGPDPRVTDRG
jgi:hypothetical protein